MIEIAGFRARKSSTPTVAGGLRFEEAEGESVGTIIGLRGAAGLPSSNLPEHDRQL